jgi:tetrahedral aminopeptidase
MEIAGTECISKLKSSLNPTFYVQINETIIYHKERNQLMTRELLQKLIDVLGPSGREHLIREMIKKEVKPYCDKLWTDQFGNLIAHKKGKGIKIMLAAHMDEIGLMVKEIHKNGHIRFAPVGGVEPITLVGQSVSILAKNNKVICNGIITTEELQDAYEIEELPQMVDLYVDTGLASKSAVKRKGIAVGDYIIPRHNATCLGDKFLISGKALDNRVGCYALIQLLKKLRTCKHDLYVVFTVQEEIGLHGAKTATYHLNPDWGIAIDTTNTEDASVEPQVTLGGGPVITYMDSEVISNSCLNDWLEKTAKKKKITLQKKVEETGTTDAARIMINKAGIPATTLSVPVRNLHSTISICDVRDATKTIAVLYSLLKQKNLRKCVT